MFSRRRRVEVSASIRRWVAIPAISHQPRRGRALSVRELYDFASWFPEHSQRLVVIAGQVGARQNVWFNLTDDLLDLKAGTLTVPAELAKNRKEHRIYLTPVELRLLREQLLARAPGTRLVFPTPTGLQWTRSGFRERVWVPAVKLATTSNEQFAGFTFHLLRHTAGSLMASFGMILRPRPSGLDIATAVRCSYVATGICTRARSARRPGDSVLRCRRPWTRSGQNHLLRLETAWTVTIRNGRTWD